MEGEKKYSPPFGTIHVGRMSEVFWVAGFVPIMDRGPFPACCPIRGSIPGVTPLPGGKAAVSAQPGYFLATTIKDHRDGHLLFWMNWKPLTMLLWYAAKRRPRPCAVFPEAASAAETSGPNGIPRRRIRRFSVDVLMGGPSRSARGLVLRVCAAKGHLSCVFGSSGKL